MQRLIESRQCSALNELFGQAIPFLFASVAKDDFIGLAYRGHFPNPLIESCVRAIERKYQTGFIGCVHCFVLSDCLVVPLPAALLSCIALRVERPKGLMHLRLTCRTVQENWIEGTTARNFVRHYEATDGGDRAVSTRDLGCGRGRWRR